MASRGRGHRGRPRGASQAPPMLDQQAFVEAVGSAAVAIAQASAIGSQGGVDEHEASKMWVLVLRGKKIHLLPTRKRSIRLMFRKDI